MLWRAAEQRVSIFKTDEFIQNGLLSRCMLNRTFPLMRSRPAPSMGRFALQSHPLFCVGAAWCCWNG